MCSIRFRGSAAFAAQSAAVPAERAVLKAKLSKLRKVFFQKLKLIKRNNMFFVLDFLYLIFCICFSKFLLSFKKASLTFGLVRKAALNEVEAALRHSRNCTLPQAKAAHVFTSLVFACENINNLANG